MGGNWGVVGAAPYKVNGGWSVGDGASTSHFPGRQERWDLPPRFSICN